MNETHHYPILPRNPISMEQEKSQYFVNVTIFVVCLVITLLFWLTSGVYILHRRRERRTVGSDIER